MDFFVFEGYIFGLKNNFVLYLENFYIVKLGVIVFVYQKDFFFLVYRENMIQYKINL